MILGCLSTVCFVLSFTVTGMIMPPEIGKSSYDFSFFFFVLTTVSWQVIFLSVCCLFSHPEHQSFCTSWLFCPHFWAVQLLQVHLSSLYHKLVSPSEHCLINLLLLCCLEFSVSQTYRHCWNRITK